MATKKKRNKKLPSRGKGTKQPKRKRQGERASDTLKRGKKATKATRR